MTLHYEKGPVLSSDPLLRLPVTPFMFRFACGVPHRLPAYPGSVWRGALGWSLKRAVCVVRHTECPDCLLYHTCAFPYLFATPPPDTEIMRKYPAAPHPFVLRIEAGQSGPEYRLGLVLIGRADRQLPYFIHALTEAGRQGLGRHRQRFDLLDVQQGVGPLLDEWDVIHSPEHPLRLHPAQLLTTPPVPDGFAVQLLSPLRLKRDEHLITPARFRFADLFIALLRRLSLLTYFHAGQPLVADYAQLAASAREVEHHDPRLQWYDWTRYSSRQATTLDMGGVLGQFLLKGSDVAEFWPYLWLGQWTHAGKGATLGMGQYRILPASLPTAP